ncbi:MAG: ring-cleaving dioxygenase [Hyphomicrobiales bacterium]|nr:MAG: ring-cleaving dioxygenase [Hyphomicrobiales bacterium]
MHGIHHVTAIAGPATRNFDFYTQVLGLRFVKKTVNFDDPGTYHFYFGDEAGSPGSILTFFPWEHAAAGRAGVGQTQITSFRVPATAIGFWTHRFVEKGVAHEAPEKLFGETVLRFTDPDGMNLALVGVAGAETEAAWATSGIPQEHALRGFHGVTLLLEDKAPTAAILTDVLGFKETAREGALTRYASGAAVGGIVDIREAKGFLAGRMGRGSVHHVAFRAADDAEQAEMSRKLVASHHQHPTGQKDRNYFRSIYFREPGGVLFEIATDQPGFAVDEPKEELGKTLKLPRFLEPRRREIEAVLPALDVAS